MPQNFNGIKVEIGFRTNKKSSSKSKIETVLVIVPEDEIKSVSSWLSTKLGCRSTCIKYENNTKKALCLSGNHSRKLVDETDKYLPGAEVSLMAKGFVEK